MLWIGSGEIVALTKVAGMERHPAPRSWPDIPLSLDQTILLTGAIGAPSFIQTIVAVAHEVCAADFVSVFCQGDRDTPLLIGTACRLGQQRALRASEGYGRHFSVDGNTEILSGKRGEGDFVTSQTAEGIASFPYRRDCYDLPGISGRVSLVRRRPDYGISVSLYSSAEAGPFDAANDRRARALLGLLLVATERHVAFSLRGTVWMAQDVQTRLALTYPDLTRREREVAAMAIKGHTARETAELLGLSETTIITHRKKAYRRMNVRSLRQLIGSR